MSSEQCTNASSTARTHRRNLHSFGKVWKLAASTTSCEYTATQSWRNKVLQRSSTRIGQRSLERLFPGFTEDSMTQATLSGGQSGIGYKKARDTAAPAHLGALIAAKPRMQAMIQDAFWAQSTSWRLASPRSSKQPPPLVSAHSTATSKQRRSCMFRRRLRRQTKLSSKQLARRHKHDSDGQRTSHLKKKTVTT